MSGSAKECTVEAPRRPIDPFVWWVAAAAVVLAGAALFGMAPGPYRPLEHQAFLAPLFAAGGALLARFPLHLTAKTKVYVDTAVITTAAILFDVPWAAAIAATSVAINEVILRDSWEQAIFNTAQAALYVGVGSAAYHVLARSSFPTVLPGIGNPVAVVACVASMYVVNTLLIATIGARQVGANPWQTWRDSVWLGMPEHAVLVVAAVAFAAVGRDATWILPILVVPSAMAYVSLRRGARAQDSAYEALKTLAMVGDLRQSRRVGHAERVAAHARAIAADLGLSPQETDDVATAARLHELG